MVAKEAILETALNVTDFLAVRSVGVEEKGKLFKDCPTPLTADVARDATAMTFDDLAIVLAGENSTVKDRSNDTASGFTVTLPLQFIPHFSYKTWFSQLRDVVSGVTGEERVTVASDAFGVKLDLTIEYVSNVRNAIELRMTFKCFDSEMVHLLKADVERLRLTYYRDIGCDGVEVPKKILSKVYQIKAEMECAGDAREEDARVKRCIEELENCVISKLP